MEYKVGDLVRSKHQDEEIIFKIEKIENGEYYIKGLEYRLAATASAEDLIHHDEETREDEYYKEAENYINLERNNFFYLPGKILHIDGDKDYLARCMHFYKEAKLDVKGLYIDEKDIPKQIKQLINQYRPDILVITGHDEFYDNHQYKNNSSFVNSVKKAREMEKAQDKLIIIAGACQSNFIDLIKAGANFASSPKGLNIHALDPAIVATLVSFSSRNEDIDLLEILNKTKYRTDGMGGIITKGTMYVGYPK